MNNSVGLKMNHQLQYLVLICVMIIASNATGSLTAKEQSAASYSTTPWSIRMAQSEMIRHPNRYSSVWDYVPGTVLKGFEQVWNASGDTNYFKYIQSTIDYVITGSGGITGYNGNGFNKYTLDNINEGKAVLLLQRLKGTSKYKIAVDTLRKQLSVHPRVSEGGFWHKLAYPHQMWLDGLYMGAPFLAEYGSLFSDTSIYSDVVKQFTIIENHVRDSATGLLYHAWDETKTRAWANPVTGCSPSFWGRAIGWYAMALVEVLDFLPSDHIGRPAIISILQRLSVGIKNYQDSTHGTWYQVMDQGSKSDNWRESSASCMFVYALAKGIRLGYLDQSFLPIAQKGYTGIINEFISLNIDSSISLNTICSSAGLDTAANGVRNGSYAYYVSGTGTPVANDGKGTGPFIMASVELEKIGFIIPPLNVHSIVSGDSVYLSWTDKSYNAISFRIERKSDLDSQFIEIGSVSKGLATYIDGDLPGGRQYFYRVRAKSAIDSSEYSVVVNATITSETSVNESDNQIHEFTLYQNYPNPFNPSTQISFVVDRREWTTLKIYDLLGREIAILFDGLAEPNITHRLSFDAHSRSSGVYVGVLRSGTRYASRKMLLLK